MLRRCLQRPNLLPNALPRPTNLIHHLRLSSAKATPKSPTPTPLRPSLHTHLSAHPRLRLPLTTLKYTLATALLLHIFSEYLYAYNGAWGISMLPTIAAEGESVVISKYFRRGRGVEVGDVVSFRHPVKMGEFAVKRVIGLGGDIVVVDDLGKGRKMVQVPKGHCWVTGDNLQWSRDSRLFGPVPLALLTGKIVAVGSIMHGFRRLNHGLQAAHVEDEELD